jgi:hypothetical protein
MKKFIGIASLCNLLALGCAPEPPPLPPPPPPADAEQPGGPNASSPATQSCDERQAKISQEADQKAQPTSIKQHLAKNFADGRVSWLMKESAYQSFVVATSAKNFGRCDDSGCYLFGAPAATIEQAVKASMKDGKHDPAALGKALGLPAKNFEGPLRMMTIDLDDVHACARLPVESDPGVWKCTSAEDKDCFKFGGYTSGGVPEVMVINAPVSQAKVDVVP